MARKKQNETKSVDLVSNNGPVPLTDDERARLSKYEATFKRLEEVIGEAVPVIEEAVPYIADVRDNRLYRETHDTFDAYCNEKLPYTRRQADRLIAALPYNKALADAGLPKLQEGAIREVADLTPEEAVEVVQAAVDAKPNGKPTAEDVANARKKIAPKPKSRSGSRSKSKLDEEYLQQELSKGTIVKVGKEYYTQNTPEYKEEMERRAGIITIKMADLNGILGLGEITFGKWVKQIGDKIASGDILAEFNTAKGGLEMEAFHEGILTETYVSNGDKLVVGQKLAKLTKTPKSAPTKDEPPKSEMVWVADYFPYADAWKYRQIPLKDVSKGAAVYASKKEAEADAVNMLSHETDLETQLKEIVMKVLDHYGEKNTAVMVQEVFRKHREDAAAKQAEDLIEEACA